MYLWKSPAAGAALSGWADQSLAQVMRAGPYWPGAALLVVMGSLAGMLPALLQDRTPSPRRRARREV